MTQYEKMTKTPIPGLIVRLSIPTIIAMMVTNIYNLVDTAFVGTLGTSQSGAVGIVFGFMSILQACGFLFGQGSGSILSRRLGARDEAEASVIASTGFFTAFLSAVVIGIISYLLLDPLVIFLGSTETIAPYAETYIRCIICVAPFMVTTFTLNNLLRFEGRAFYGMIGLMTGAVLNIGGDALFMFVFDMGILGAGLSTAISQVISFCVLLIPFFRGKTQCRLSIRKVRWGGGRIGDIFAVGFPSLIRQGLQAIATILLNSEAGVFGDAAVAGMSIVSRIFMFIFSVSIGVGQGFQPVSGFNYGAKKYSRLRQGFRFTWLFSEVLVVILAGLVFAFSGSLVALFRDDPEVIEIATRALRLQCGAVIFLPFTMVTEMCLQSTGQKLSAAFMSSLRSGLIFIPLLLIMSRLRGLMGIEEAQPLTYVLVFIPAIFVAIHFFRRLPDQDG